MLLLGSLSGSPSLVSHRTIEGPMITCVLTRKIVGLFGCVTIQVQ
jgi:hypothetical protein